MVQSRSEKYLESELAELQIAANNFAVRFVPDAKVRRDYIEVYEERGKNISGT